MMSRFAIPVIFGLTVGLSNTVIANTIELKIYEQLSNDQVQEYATNSAASITEVIDSILSSSSEENTQKLWNELFLQLSEVFYTLTGIANSHVSSSEVASQSIEDLNGFITEVMNYPPFHQKLLEFSQEILLEDEKDQFQCYITSSLEKNRWQEIGKFYSYPQSLDNLIAKSSNDRNNDRDDNRGEHRVGGGIKGKWGDGKGISWEGYLEGSASDGKGNYAETRIIHRDDGTGEIEVYGGHEGRNE